MNNSKLKKIIKEKDLINKKILINFSNIVNIIKKISSTIENRATVFTCGNGGSAGDAQHIAAEGIVRLNPKKNRKPFPIINLAMDTSTLTACANDYGYENIFSRSFEAMAKKNDLLICFSTSGNSKNIINVLKKAKKLNISSVSFLGGNGGKAKKYSNLSIIVPSKNVARIQETHIFLGHYILDEVERYLLKRKVV